MYITLPASKLKKDYELHHTLKQGCRVCRYFSVSRFLKRHEWWRNFFQVIFSELDRGCLRSTLS